MYLVSSWHSAPAAPNLQGANIHLWWIDCTTASGAKAFLSPDERERAARSAHPAAFICFRSALRRILARYVGLEPQELKLDYGPLGKPFLVHPQTTPSFNLAHSGGHGLLALGNDVELGVDLERVLPFPRAVVIARRQLGEAIADRLALLPGPARSQAFFEEWTLMEARAKAGGGGVFAPPKTDYETVSFAPRAGWCAALASSRPLLHPCNWLTFELDRVG
jgi:4'-phosphopantetheinyl transferase